MNTIKIKTKRVQSISDPLKITSIYGYIVAPNQIAKWRVAIQFDSTGFFLVHTSSRDYRFWVFTQTLKIVL